MINSLLQSLCSHWERKLLILVVVFALGLLFTREVILEPPQKPQETSFTIPPPPQLVPWQGRPPLVKDHPTDPGDRNPFLVTFPMEKSSETPQETAKSEERLPPQPPRRTVAITYQGIRTTLSGKTYAILEVSDSKLGASNHFLQEGEALPCGITIEKMSERGLELSDKSGNELGDLPYGTTKIVTMEGE